MTITSDDELFDIIEECYEDNFDDDCGGHYDGDCDTDSTDMGG